MVEYGTNIVGGCTPGKGGMTVELQGKEFPVWDSMFDAIQDTDADATVIYVPPPFAAEAIMEAADAFDSIKGEGVVVCITEGNTYSRHGEGSIILLLTTVRSSFNRSKLPRNNHAR